ncbi:MAG TPA: cupin domain-containing protein [Candidatus Saccharimonadales bacterium]|jgi:ethanolamine utilization protein EutQ (cupin superfamily)|nr:cupin domain-containing protein [Candidatus Saccharimonadales bacterium]
MYKIVRQSEGTVRQIADNKLANNLITKDISPEVSFATTEATDYYEKETTEYNRIYYVLEGELELTRDGEATTLRQGDACFISKGTTYEMRGTFKAVTVNQPAFGSLAS